MATRRHNPPKRPAEDELGDEEKKAQEAEAKAKAEERRHDARKVVKATADREERRVEEAAEARGIAVSAVVTKLEFDLPSLAGISITVPPAEPVTEQDVDNRLAQLRHQVAQARGVPFGERVERGDQVALDVMGYNEGELFLTLVQEWMIVGDNPMLPGFFAEVEGMFVGEEKAFQISLPDDYVDPALRSAVAAFAVKIHSARRPELPELNDEFWTILGVAGEAEARDAIRGEIVKWRADELVQRAQEMVLDEVQRRAEVELDEEMIKQALNELWRQQEGDHLASQNATLEQQAEARERFLEDESIREEVRRSFFERALLDKVIEARQLEASEDDVLKFILELAGGTTLSTNRVHEQLTGSGGWDDAMYGRLRDMRAMEWILQQVNVEFTPG